jgi:hypothetical protein
MPKRTNQSKDEIASAMVREQLVNRQKVLARMVFPTLEPLDSLYEAQTVLNAVAGHIKYGISINEGKLKISDLELDLKAGKPSKIKTAVLTILEMMENEPATEIEKLTELMAGKIPEHIATIGLKQPMSSLPMNEFIAD